MSNSFITPQIVAREALSALKNTLVMGGLVHRDFSSEFRSVGDTVTIRKPASFTAADFDPATGSTAQAITEGSVDVKLDKFKDVTVEIGSKERALDLADFRTQIIQPAADALAQAIDYDLTGLYAYVPYTTGAAGTTPDALNDLTDPMVKLNQNKAPLSPRNFVWDPVAQGKMLQLDAIVGADKSGSTAALRAAAMGQLMGFDNYMSQNVRTHTAGAGTVAIDLVAGYSAGDTAIHVDGVTTALKVGDALTIATKQYTVVAAGALATADQDITIYPGLVADVANDVSVTVAASHTANLAFHKNAFALVTAPLEMPMSGINAEVITDPASGLTLRVVYDWNNKYKRDEVSIDVLYGVKAINPELAVRHLG